MLIEIIATLWLGFSFMMGLFISAFSAGMGGSMLGILVVWLISGLVLGFPSLAYFALQRRETSFSSPRVRRSFVIAIALVLVFTVYFFFFTPADFFS